MFRQMNPRGMRGPEGHWSGKRGEPPPNPRIRRYPRWRRLLADAQKSAGLFNFTGGTTPCVLLDVASDCVARPIIWRLSASTNGSCVAVNGAITGLCAGHFHTKVGWALTVGILRAHCIPWRLIAGCDIASRAIVSPAAIGLVIKETSRNGDRDVAQNVEIILFAAL